MPADPDYFVLLPPTPYTHLKISQRQVSSNSAVEQNPTK